MTVRTSRNTSRYLKSRSIDVSHFEPYDIGHVRCKFPNAPDFLIERLGKAISRRRQYIKYMERHAIKLAHSVDDNTTVANLSETVASSLVGDTENIYDHPPSVATETSFATSIGNTSRARLPSMPIEAANGQHFECPYCRTVEIVKDTRAWKIHVYRDLQPYVCTFEECLTPDETYESRHRWLSHELQKHRRRIWTCGSHCNLKFQSAAQLVGHINSFSAVPISDAQIPSLIEMRATFFDSGIEASCPLCRLLVSGSTQLQKHIGHHLEELSIFALPSMNEDSDDSKCPEPTSPTSLYSAEGLEQEATSQLAATSEQTSEQAVTPEQEVNLLNHQSANSSLKKVWWYCCECGNLNNPDLSPDRCSVNYHARCDMCRVAP